METPSANAPSYIGAAAILEKKKKYIMPCLGHFYSEPRQIVRGEMQYLYDSEGRQYLDCFAGVSSSTAATAIRRSTPPSQSS